MRLDTRKRATRGSWSCSNNSDAFHDTSPAAAPAVCSDVNVGKDEDLSLGFSDDEMADVREKLRGWGFAG
jgi:hypothetical protein